MNSSAENVYSADGPPYFNPSPVERIRYARASRELISRISLSWMSSVVSITNIASLRDSTFSRTLRPVNSPITPFPRYVIMPGNARKLDIGLLRLPYYTEIAANTGLLQTPNYVNALEAERGIYKGTQQENMAIALDQTCFDAKGKCHHHLPWLIYDLMLTDVLSALNLSWCTIEDAIYRVFVSLLPKGFQSGLQETYSPYKEYAFWIWRNELKHWLGSPRCSDVEISKIKRSLVNARSRGLQSEYIATLEAELQYSEPQKWALRGEGILNYTTQSKSPIIAPVLDVIRKTIWNEGQITKDGMDRFPEILRPLYNRYSDK